MSKINVFGKMTLVLMVILAMCLVGCSDSTDPKPPADQKATYSGISESGKTYTLEITPNTSPTRYSPVSGDIWTLTESLTSNVCSGTVLSNVSGTITLTLTNGSGTLSVTTSGSGLTNISGSGSLTWDDGTTFTPPGALTPVGSGGGSNGVGWPSAKLATYSLTGWTQPIGVGDVRWSETYHNSINPYPMLGITFTVVTEASVQSIHSALVGYDFAGYLEPASGYQDTWEGSYVKTDDNYQYGIVIGFNLSQGGGISIHRLPLAIGTQSATYIGVAGGETYTLKVTEYIAPSTRYTPKEDDDFRLSTSPGGKVCTGKVTWYNGTIRQMGLQPSYANAGFFNAEVIDSNLTYISGLSITWDDGTTTPGNFSLTADTPPPGTGITERYRGTLHGTLDVNTTEEGDVVVGESTLIQYPLTISNVSTKGGGTFSGVLSGYWDYVYEGNEKIGVVYFQNAFPLGDLQEMVCFFLGSGMSESGIVAINIFGAGASAVGITDTYEGGFRTPDDDL